MPDGKITATCACGAAYRVPESSRGKTFRCKKCGKTFAVSEPTIPAKARGMPRGGPAAARPASSRVRPGAGAKSSRTGRGKEAPKAATASRGRSARAGGGRGRYAMDPEELERRREARARRRKIIVPVVAVLVLAGGGYGGWTYYQAKTLADRIEAERKDMTDAYEAAEAFFREQKYDPASRKLEKVVVSEHGPRGKALALRGQSFYYLRDFEKASADLQQLVASGDEAAKSWKVRFALGRCLLALRNLTDAEKEFRASEGLQPTSSDVEELSRLSRQKLTVNQAALTRISTHLAELPLVAAGEPLGPDAFDASILSNNFRPDGIRITAKIPKGQIDPENVIQDWPLVLLALPGALPWPLARGALTAAAEAHAVRLIFAARTEDGSTVGVPCRLEESTGDTRLLVLSQAAGGFAYAWADRPGQAPKPLAGLSGELGGLAGTAVALSGELAVPLEAIAQAASIIRQAGLSDPILIITPEMSTYGAILCGLDWLQRHQSVTGAWSAEKFHDDCSGSTPCGGEGNNKFDVGVTSLAVLSFLALPGAAAEGAPARKAVEKALRFLEQNVGPDGALGSPGSEESRPVLDSALALLAVAQARRAGISGGETCLSRTTRYLVDAMRSDGGWGRTADESTATTAFSTGICVWALRLSQEAGESVPPEIFQKPMEYFDGITDKVHYEVYYGSGRLHPAYKADRKKGFFQHYTMNAHAMFARVLATRRNDHHHFRDQTTQISQDLPTWEGARKADAWYWVAGSLALRLARGPGPSGPGDPAWQDWRRELSRVLITKQAAPDKECASGSWPDEERWLIAGGRPYVTAACTLSLILCTEQDTITQGLLP